MKMSPAQLLCKFRANRLAAKVSFSRESVKVRVGLCQQTAKEFVGVVRIRERRRLQKNEICLWLLVYFVSGVAELG